MDWLVNMSAEHRSAAHHLVCEIVARFDMFVRTVAMQFTCPPPRQSSATRFGLTAVCVDRMLQSLRHQGIAPKVGEVVAIMDRDILVRFAERGPVYPRASDLHDRFARSGGVAPVKVRLPEAVPSQRYAVTYLGSNHRKSLATAAEALSLQTSTRSE